MTRFFLIYLILVNLTAFMLYGIDKIKARHHKWRIPEATLLLAAAIGGSAGALLGMLVFRHKTKHLKFVIGVPLILITELLAYLYFFKA